MRCQAVADIGGLYVYCPMERDVTQAANWTIADSTVARLTSPGTFTAVTAGHTVIHATWNNLDAARAIAVFPGTPPLPTNEIFGNVSDTAQGPAVGISGAVVQVLDGLVAGQTATSGVPPPLLPGYGGPVGGAGYYRILGVPMGTYHLRITKEGYISQDRTVTVINAGSPAADFQLAKE